MAAALVVLGLLVVGFVAGCSVRFVRAMAKAHQNFHMPADQRLAAQLRSGDQANSQTVQLNIGGGDGGGPGAGAGGVFDLDRFLAGLPGGSFVVIDGQRVPVEAFRPGPELETEVVEVRRSL